GLRGVYEQTAGLSKAPDRWWLVAGNLEQTPGDRGYIEIRSRFFRALNRRFHAADFWPEHVPVEFRERWFGLAPIVAPFYAGEQLTQEERFVNDQLAAVFVERDISSSQTQLLAAFLGLVDLEELAGRKDPKFKTYLAERLWALHERDHDVLKDGYSGPHDARL